MNKKQLEGIRKKCVEIKQLIDTDITGSSYIDDYLRNLKSKVENDLKDLVWLEYNAQFEKDNKKSSHINQYKNSAEKEHKK